MKILCIGDIFGKPGRIAVEKFLPELLEKQAIDFTVANGENSAGGNGMNRKVLEQLSNIGVDVFTMGNHTWGNKELLSFIDEDKRIIRPANYTPGVPGHGWRSFEVKGQKIAVCNIIGRIFMDPSQCPFNTMNQILAEIQEAGIKTVLVDFHAEATSEKIAMGWYLDGRVSAIFGTHTHVQTNDARLLNKGTAYITDIGMTGPRDSVLGVDKNLIIKKMTTQIPVRFEPAGGDIQFNGIILEIAADGKAENIEVLNFYQPSL